jgi:hypothetical protein
LTTKKLIACLVFIQSTIFSFELPNAWFKAGNNPGNYEMGVDKGAGKDSKNAATIKSKVNNIDGFGTLMQNCSPAKYLGKRIRMSGFLKAKDVSDWAGLWLRIDTKIPVKAFAFDNMHDGKKDISIKGTMDWKKYEIVLDVPDNASKMAYGALLSGAGQIWFDNFHFEIVPSSISTTGIEMETNSSSNPHLTEPTNLDFEK